MPMNTAQANATFAKDFLSILDLGHLDLERLLALAAQIKSDRHMASRAPTAAAFAGVHVGLLFEKATRRAQSTLEVSVREPGGDTLDVPSEFAGGTREPLEY